MTRPSGPAPVRPRRRPAARATGAVDTRALPRYRAGEIDVTFGIKVTDETLPRDTRWDEHSHPTHELLWNQRGASTATIGARVWTITPLVGLWIPAGTPHSGWTPAGTQHRAAHFAVHRAPSIADGPTTVSMTPLLRLLLERTDDGTLTAESRAVTEAMVIDVLTPARSQLLLQIPSAPLLAPLVAAVLDDPADTTTLYAWSARLGVSSRTITRTLRAQTGLGFSQWLSTARIQRAISLLARDEPIDDVAARVGYHSVSAFTTAFRRVVGTTPGRFRLQ